MWFIVTVIFIGAMAGYAAFSDVAPSTSYHIQQNYR
jgi:hypothetical protein